MTSRIEEWSRIGRWVVLAVVLVVVLAISSDEIMYPLTVSAKCVWRPL